ncbi:PorT family protein [Sphingobacterium phlebotomi]|uniref:PorT family protein n=1 Tax=Sphingobacterium phlebotomi TaxID=2605433 RepID=A0A5D4H0D8_9SPHI|nr:porin family protein [Sphingobacterium phlebotomi]TYR33934.1 PorT family protein [Sphingobacterium phlebotomi]
MKKILLSLGAAFLLAAGANAQVSYGVKAGVNLPKQVVKISGSGVNASVESGTTTSFYVSGYANIFAAPNFAIQPGLSLQGKGGEMDMTDLGGEKYTTNIMSLDIPVNAVYYIPTGNTGSVFVGAGPYVGFHLSGKDKISGGESYDVEFGSGEDETKRVDFGLNFQLGYKLANGFLINGGYGLGLANLLNFEAEQGVSMKGHNRVLSFGVGFEF